MATWIVHLRLAENLLELIEGLDAGEFAIGNIAPDSGIPDENWENFTPPPEVSHFAGPPDEAGWQDITDLEFYRRYLARSCPSDNQGRFSFLLGYFFHLVTDNLWNNHIGRPTKARFAAEFEAAPKFVWEIKGDWYGLDHI
ncbi:MAG: zinc dependent phospholipase C family protein [Anaerolineae bacterium]